MTRRHPTYKTETSPVLRAFQLAEETLKELGSPKLKTDPKPAKKFGGSLARRRTRGDGPVKF